ncbi:EamA family transporter [Streptomyces sp. MST-110588]|uniref:EamA family transporter n=1 Tax=Streptomyces sp. MST-110588 TaxID=2833628 RepID=UPI001F5CA66E|nr:EamA family transporter [Streptomyces sp. MST-110588]UNO43591.1 EamA family transporter [Streptomyces sp. MST-110588]
MPTGDSKGNAGLQQLMMSARKWRCAHERGIWNAAMLGVVALWGWTFVGIGDALETMTFLSVLTYRFLGAALLLGVVHARSLCRLTLRELTAGSTAGTVLFAAYAFQTASLLRTTASNVGFITGTAVVFTAVLAALFLRERLTGAQLLGTGLVMAGLALLTLQGLAVHWGDVLALACAACFAGHLILLGQAAPDLNTGRLAFVQLATVGLLGLLGAVALGGGLSAPAGQGTWATLAVVAVGASALAYFIQTRAQRVLPPTRIAMIMTAEPAFAGLFGYWLAGDRLTGWNWAGAALILASITFTSYTHRAAPPQARAGGPRHTKLSTKGRTAMDPAIPNSGLEGTDRTEGARKRQAAGESAIARGDPMTERPDTDIRTIHLTSREAAGARALVREQIDRYARPEHPHFLRSAPALGARLPDVLREALGEMRYLETDPALVVTGYPWDPQSVGPTPEHWRDHCGQRTREADFWLLLLGAQLGDPFSWSFLQDGRLITDILPLREKEHAQSGHASAAYQYLHVEDAFHPCRPDYIGLVSLRNPGTATTVSPVTTGGLSPEQTDILFCERFQIFPDLEHTSGLDEDGRPSTISALFGSRDRPYARIDPPFMSALPGDSAAQQALDALCTELESAATSVVLEPGAVLLLDNFRAVHGRKPFTARYDGTDRWLRRMTMTRDLRKSRALRKAVDARVVGAG